MMDLKPCPFCGDQPKTYLEVGEAEDTIFCGKCFAEGPCVTPQSPSEAWNTRPREDALQAEVDRLREALIQAREGLSIAAGWARSKPDSGRARDKIKAGLDAIRFALNPRAALKGAPHE